jgi:hypothetical protein
VLAVLSLHQETGVRLPEQPFADIRIELIDEVLPVADVLDEFFKSIHAPLPVFYLPGLRAYLGRVNRILCIVPPPLPMDHVVAVVSRRDNGVLLLCQSLRKVVRADGGKAGDDRI